LPVLNTQTDGITTVYSFPTWFDFVDQAKSRVSPVKDNIAASRAPDIKNWSQTKDFDTAHKLAERGWSAGASKVSALGEAMFDELSGLIRKPQVVFTDDPGIEIDVARYIEGEPDCHVHLEDNIKRGASRQIVRLVYNATASSSVPPDIIVARGATVAALVMMMEYSGAGVEVVCFIGISEKNEIRYPNARGKAVEVYSTIKSSDQPVDVTSLAYALAHPSTFRRFGFAVMEGLTDQATRDALSVPGYYGYPCEASHQGDLYIPAAKASDKTWLNPVDARRWVIEALKQQGVAMYAVTT
jgi:hypothetical protein